MAAARGLRAILDGKEPPPARDFDNPADCRGLSIDVYRDNCFSLGRNRFLDPRGIDRVISCIDIDQNWRGAAGQNRGHRRHGGMRHRDDVIALSNAERLERQSQRIGAAGYADPFGRAAEVAKARSKASTSSPRM